MPRHRIVSLLAFAFVLFISPSHVQAFFAVPTCSTKRTVCAATVPRVASPEIIRAVLKDGTTTVVDARSLEELQEDGHFRCGTCRWIHAPATPNGTPLLERASGYLLPDREASVVVYCASGIRAEATRKVLEEAGYAHVLNAGGLADLKALIEQ